MRQIKERTWRNLSRYECWLSLTLKPCNLIQTSTLNLAIPSSPVVVQREWEDIARRPHLASHIRSTDPSPASTVCAAREPLWGSKSGPGEICRGMSASCRRRPTFSFDPSTTKRRVVTEMGKALGYVRLMRAGSPEPRTPDLKTQAGILVWMRLQGLGSKSGPGGTCRGMSAGCRRRPTCFALWGKPTMNPDPIQITTITPDPTQTITITPDPTPDPAIISKKYPQPLW